MNAERLLALYERVAEAQGAVPRLRRFVLDLAVRGKLVAQDPADEPASELLKRIAAEKARLVKAGEIRKKAAQAPKMVDPPHELPASWRWVPLGTIFLYDAGAKREPKSHDPSLWLLELEDIEKETGRLLTRVAVADRESKSTKSEFQLGDILYGKLRPYLSKVIVADKPGYSTTEIVAIRPFVPLCSEYCALALRRPDFVDYVTRLGQGTKMPRLRTEDAVVSPFPLPPLAEQRRIVAKVEELMALLDRLEAARAAREATRDRLTAASLARLTAPDTEPEEIPTDARFAIARLPALTARADQIKPLRQTILNLAVRGKLVEQDPADEPASELLKRIAAEKARLGEAGEIAKDKPVPALSEEERPFALPPGWIWSRLGSVVLSSDAGWSPRTENHPREGDAWGVLKVSAVSWDHFDPDANKQVLPGTEPRLQAQVREGDFLISRANTAELVARAVLVREEPHNLMMSDKIVRLRLANDCDHRFAWLVNNYGDYARTYYAANATGVSPSMKNVSRAVILNLPIPIPPLAEQHRIVAKVDALMALCDRLEAALARADATRARLLETLLHEALTPPDAADLAAA